MVGPEITAKTFGIVGTGTIGKALVKLLSGFDVRVLVYDIEKDNNFKKKYDVTYLAIDKLLSQSDSISAQLPSTDETECIIAKKGVGHSKAYRSFIQAADDNWWTPKRS